MVQVINTNFNALKVQNSLNKKSNLLSQTLERLSTGLRINSAKNDPAGLGIAIKFASQISAFSQVQRNANDAISLSQIAEGALAEATSILQRGRDLAVQAANGSNSATDRQTLQTQVNQLKSEFSNIVSSTTYNGMNLLNGDLSSINFQTGANAEQNIALSLKDKNISQLGANQIKTDNQYGLEAATTQAGTSRFATTLGTPSITGPNAAARSYTITDSANNNETITTTANATAQTIIGELEAATNISEVSGYYEFDLDVSALAFATTDEIAFTNGELSLASATYADSNALTSALDAVAGFNAQLSGDTITIYSDKSTNAALDDFTITITNNGANSSVSTGGVSAIDGSPLTIGANLELTVSDGTTVALDGIEQKIFADANTLAAANNLSAQTITINGTSGPLALAIASGASAKTIATSINATTENTGVSAQATTQLQISNLSNDGSVAFALTADNTSAVNISASITTTDFTNLMDAINDVSGTTGVVAKLDGADNILKLTNAAGSDIGIENFTHSASGASEQEVESIDVLGNSDSNLNGVTARLYTGGATTLDSTVVGGQLSLVAPQAFSMSSNINGSDPIAGGLFAASANSAINSSLSSVRDIDILTATSAQDAISVFDQAISQISSTRAEFGAMQNRFESVASRASLTQSNLTQAKSNIVDANFALETGELVKNQILMQAAVAMLTQANSLPESLLSLLRD